MKSQIVSPSRSSMTETTNPRVSVILANWNGRDILSQAITSVIEHTKDLSYEIIVVDDGSTDDSVDMVKANFPKVLLVVNSVNQGFAKSNNIGVSRATGEYVLLLNSDTILFDNSIRILVEFMDSHSEAGVCGGWLKNVDMSGQVSYGDFPTFHQGLCDALFLNDLFPGLRFPNRGVIPDPASILPIEVDYVTGADILIRREIIERIGLFDPLFEAYCEETDFCFRVKHELHRKVFFVPQAQIIHLGGVSYGKLGKRRIQIHYASYDKFLTKHYGTFYSFCTRLLYAWHHAVKLLTRTIRYVTSPTEERKNHLLNAWYTVCYSIAPRERFSGS